MNIVMRAKMLVAFIVQFILKLFTSAEVVGQPIDLFTDGWKFNDSDSIGWASPQYDDTEWANISVGKSWEAHFNKDFDGIAWYRRTVTVSKSLEKATKKSGSMMLKLGMIDDADETYFNGVKIGATGKFPPDSVSAFDVPRNYTVPYDLIKWDAPNVIAIRVADWGGAGGLYAGEYSLEPISWKNKFKFIIDYAEPSNAFGLGKPVVIKPQFLNNSDEDLRGVLTCEIKKFTGEKVETKEQNVKILSAAKSRLPSGLRGPANRAEDFIFDVKEIGFYVAYFSFKDKNGYSVKDKKGFAVAPESFKPMLTRPADFDDYWQRAKDELRDVAPDYRLIPLPKRSNDKVEVFEVEFYSLGGVRVRGYYTRPRAKVNVPALLHVQGYSSFARCQ